MLILQTALGLGASMKYGRTDTPDDDIEADEDEDETAPLEERLNTLRSIRNSSGGYSPQARQRIEYLQELRRLRAQVGDDAIETF